MKTLLLFTIIGGFILSFKTAATIPVEGNGVKFLSLNIYLWSSIKKLGRL